ncbi:YggS family pyridoxal phosphate-dependent enzyme [Candidatus Fermentibacteria bacterium]|nr:YggS family pyridoxal phosphate-dependent enzyme [Candidatus Fermentibacteria bacterium]
MVTLGDLHHRVVLVRESIAQAAHRVNRDPRDVTVVAVTKNWPAEAVRMAIEAGLTDIGENRVQEAAAKIAALTPETRFHLVGHLQRNKAAKAAGMFDVIHSVASEELASRLSSAAAHASRVVDVLLQVNVALDPAKHGIGDADVRRLLSRLEPLPGIRVVGLMTIGPLATPEESRPHFRALRELRDGLAKEHPGIRHLSMGMSSDYAVAVEEGATMVRIGTVLFGPRTE